jgi:hypothetical protein
MTNKTQFPFYNPKAEYEKLPHKHQVGEDVALPGTRIRSQHYKNQFLYNKTGIIQKRGWSKRPVSIKDEKVYKEDGVSFWWSNKLVHVPMYFVNGRWYGEGKKAYGVTTI